MELMQKKVRLADGISFLQPDAYLLGRNSHLLQMESTS